MKTALITGASGGIGKELAKVFAKKGHDLVLVARSEQALRDLAEGLQKEFGIRARVIVKDLNRTSAPWEIYGELQQESIPVDILVNNAGFGTSGPFKDTDLAAELDMLQVNIAALTHLTKLFVRDMVKRGEGKILNVASTAAFQPGPLMAVYYATKAYVLSFSEAIGTELKGTGVSVTTLCPGLTESNFQARAGIKNLKLTQIRLMDAYTVAWAGYEGLMKNKTVVIPGLTNKILVGLVRLTPRPWITRIIHWLHREA